MSFAFSVLLFSICSIKWCLSESWYLANDMQMHWIAPIVLIPLSIKYLFGFNFDASSKLLSVCVSLYLSFRYSKKAKILAFFMCFAFLLTSILSTALTLNSFPGSEKANRGLVINGEQLYFWNILPKKIILELFLLIITLVCL